MEDTYAHERTAALGGMVNHCPHGCGPDDLDEYGYCRHLVGFTNDGRTVETVQAKMNRDGSPGSDKFVSCRHKDVVKEGDILVNPERRVLDKGIATVAKSWVSSRVYRQTASVEAIPDDSPPKTKKLAKV